MKEIEFRCFDKIRNVMRYQDNCQFVFGRDYKECNYENGWNTENNGIFMQYVGLKDIKNKKIFEGDIVSVIDLSYLNNDRSINRESSRYHTYRKGIVEHVEYNCSFMIMRRFEGREIVNQWNSSEQLRPSDENHEIEVIGNIYENKELL